MADPPLDRGLFSLGTEFNDFLYERIGAGSWDTQVSVVSVLARLGLDPWVEAERLSRLPDETATHSISTLLSRIPEIAIGIAGRQQTARRLVQLLPRRFAGNRCAALTGSSIRARPWPWLVIAGIICVLPLLLAAELFWQNHPNRGAVLNHPNRGAVLNHPNHGAALHNPLIAAPVPRSASTSSQLQAADSQTGK